MTKKKVKCIPVGLIKKQVENAYENIRCCDGIHKDTWSRYPCLLLEKELCRNDHCSGEISLSICTPPRDIRIITIFSIRAERKDYAYLNQHLRSLFSKGILNNIPPVEKDLSMPIISSTTSYFENPPPPLYSFNKNKN